MEEKPIEQNQTESGMTPPEEQTSKPGSVGPVVAIIIIVAVLILGGLYYWGVQLNKQDRFESMTAEEIENLPDETRESLESQGTSDTLESIEEDLNTTELEGLDTELEQVEEELNNL